MFSWALPESPFMIMPAQDVTIFPSGSKEACTAPGSTKQRRRDASLSRHVNTTSELSKRATRYGPLVPRIEGLVCAGDVDVGEIPSCDACSGGDDPLQKRAETCWLDPYRSRGQGCPDDGEESSSLQRRADKSVSWTDHNAKTGDLPLPSYPSCGVAPSSVIRWFGYPAETGRECKVALEKYTSKDIEPGQYETEHIYEAQYLVRFFKWLVKGDLPVGYDNPNHQWIDEVLLGIGGSTRIYQSPAWTLHDENMWHELSICMGHDRELGRLALTHKDVNGRKTIFFQGKSPDPRNQENNVATRRAHRNTAGAFYYMRRPEIWSRFVQTSHAIEQIFDDFDIDFEWGGLDPMNDGEPDRPTDRVNGQPRPGLRDLYCYWLDTTLAEMEGKAAAWLTAATANFKADFEHQADGKKWLDNVLTSNGYISASKLKFPQASVSHRRPNRADPDIWTQSNYQGLWNPELGAAGPF